MFFSQTAVNKLLPGQDLILIGVQPVEGHLHFVLELPSTHLHAGEGGGPHPYHDGI